MNIDILKNVYHALLFSHLRYGIIVWGNAAQSSLQPLEILVNKAIRIMAFIPNGNFDLSQVYKDLKLLELSAVHKLETAKYMFKSEKSLLPFSLGNYFEIDRCAEEHSHFILLVTIYLSMLLVILPLELNVEQELGKNLINLLGPNYGLNCQLILKIVDLIMFLNEITKSHF